MKLHRHHRRRDQPAAPAREEAERSRLLSQLDRERRRVTSLDADVRAITRRQDEIRRRARPTLPLSLLPSPPGTAAPSGPDPVTNGLVTTITDDVAYNPAAGLRTGPRVNGALRSNSLGRRDQELDAHIQLALARADEAAAQRRIERAERLIKIQTIEGLIARLGDGARGGGSGYEEGSERESVLTA